MKIVCVRRINEPLMGSTALGATRPLLFGDILPVYVAKDKGVDLEFTDALS